MLCDADQFPPRIHQFPHSDVPDSFFLSVCLSVCLSFFLAALSVRGHVTLLWRGWEGECGGGGGGGGKGGRGVVVVEEGFKGWKVVGGRGDLEVVGGLT